MCAVVLSAASHVADARLGPVMGFQQTFIDASSPAATPRFERVTRSVDLACLDEDASLPRREFRIRWEGVWHVPATRWVDLYAGADDRITVRIDGAIVIDRVLALGMGTGRIRIPLNAGDRHLVVEYEQGGGGYGINLMTGPAGDAPHSFAHEAVFPSTPGRRTLATISALSWLRRAVALAWALLALALFATLGGRRFLGAIREFGRAWLTRHRTNWRRWRDGDVSNGGAGVSTPLRQRRPAIVVLFVLSVAAGLGLFGTFYEARTGFTSLIGFGGRFAEEVLPAVRAVPHYVYPDSAGYDGQFYAQLAVDPHPRSPALAAAIDSLPYRAKRILFSWSGYLLGFGRPAWVLQAYAVQNIVVWALLALLLSRWMPPASIRHWAAWCGCLFASGMIFSVRFSLTEGPSLALTALAISAAERGRPLIASAIIGVSGLGRESNLLASAAALLPASLGRRPWLTWLLMALVLAAPLLLWLTYLQSVFGPGIWGAGGDNLTMPLAGIIGKISTTMRDLRVDGWASPAQASVLALVGATVQGAYLLWRAEWQSAWWRAGVPYAVLAGVLGSQVWEGNPGAYVRVLLPMTIAYNVLITGRRRFWMLFVAGNLSVITSMASLLRGLPTP